MDDLSVIDRFMATFIRYIDSGFGLLGGDVAFLTSILIGIDITLAGLFWAMGGEQDVIAKLLRKILYVGVFAFILNSFPILSEIVFKSFAQAGITAGGGSLSADSLLKPGVLASTGFSAAWPLLDQASKMMGFVSFFDNFLTIMVLLFAWAITIIAFFILSVQMFVTIIEFKLTSLAGFILVPFALWNRTSFLAERVLGNVVSSGIKVMVLAVIVGIGSNFFSEFTSALNGREPDIGQAMSLVLASLALFGLGIFAPGIASGLVAGAPQLGAGAAVGTVAGAVGAGYVAGSAVGAGARGVAGGAISAIRAGTTVGTAAGQSYRMGQNEAGSATVAAGLGGVAKAAGHALRERASQAAGLDIARERGNDAAWSAFQSGQDAKPAANDGASGPPRWARDMRAEQSSRHHRHVALQAVREGDRGGASAAPDIKEKED
jgi:type IV secretion system protein TrbL